MRRYGAHSAGGPLLAALVSGEAAEAIEKVPAGEAVAEALTVLRGIFEPQGVQVPTPLQVKQQHSTLAVKTMLRHLMTDCYNHRVLDDACCINTACQTCQTCGTATVN